MSQARLSSENESKGGHRVEIQHGREGRHN